MNIKLDKNLEIDMADVSDDVYREALTIGLKVLYHEGKLEIQRKPLVRFKEGKK